jgi:hypothetical protein
MVEDQAVSTILLWPRTAAHNTASGGAFMANEQVRLQTGFSVA